MVTGKFHLISYQPLACRKMQGSDYSTWVAVSNTQFSIDSGSKFILMYELNQSGRDFCSNCGTCVYGNNGKHFKKHKKIPLGIVENYSVDTKPKFQSYTENKAEWLALNDKVPISVRKSKT